MPPQGCANHIREPLPKWIEGRQMMEVLTPEMQQEYLAAMAKMPALTQ